MKYQTFFVMALVIVSGFIAYFGDLLGRRMGKKRLTLWNLRPRYTAIVVTTITGMLISTLALILFISLDQQFAKVFKEGVEILETNTRLNLANARLGRRNQVLVDSCERLEKEVARRRKEVREARKDAAEAKKARDKAQAVVMKLERNIATKQKELDSLHKRTNLAEGELKQRTQELTAVRDRLVSAQKQLTQTQAMLQEAHTHLQDAVVKLSETKDKLKATEDKLSEREAQLAKAEKVNADLTLATAVGRSKEPIAHQGEELLRGVISPVQAPSKTRDDLYALLEQASQKAVERGAKVGDNKRAVLVVYKQIVSTGSKQFAVLDDDEPACVEAAVDTISKSPQDVVVQLVSAVNSFPGDQVSVELRLYVNFVVYPKGSKIDSVTINGRLSEGRVLLLLLDFLQKQLAETAVHAGVIPASNPNPRAALGPNPREQADELMSTLDRIKAINGRTRVEVFATTDIHAADSINVKNARLEVAQAD